MAKFLFLLLTVSLAYANLDGALLIGAIAALVFISAMWSAAEDSVSPPQ
jgi:hypothetical protein